MPGLWERVRHRHLLHQWYLRLDDWRLECSYVHPRTGWRCGAIKHEPKRHKAR